MTNTIDSSTTGALTIDSVYQTLQNWRKNKKNPATSIPDSIWQQIFKLADCYTPQQIRKLFGISKQQYDIKHHKLFGSHDTVVPQQPASPIEPSTTTPEQDPQFCEVNALNPHHPSNADLTLKQQDLHQLRTNHPASNDYLDRTTIVVEFFRADGQRMKIHTTSQSFPDLINAFLK